MKDLPGFREMNAKIQDNVIRNDLGMNDESNHYTPPLQNELTKASTFRRPI